MGHVGRGHVIAGKYRLEDKLGQGGMGAVWSAEHLDLHSRVAVKLIVPDHADDEGMLARFVREARSAAALRSPHVVQILDYGVDQGLAYIAMEKLEGESLSERLKRDGRLTLASTASILTHVARAVTKAHESGLMHRDLKPENIFLVKNDDEIVAKVLDFGIVKARPGTLAATGAVTETGVLLGSPYYMSPEQAHGRSDVDHRSDLWAMAVIAYECMTGERPFSGDVLGEVMLQICVEPIPVPSAIAEVPRGFDEWFLHATKRDPEMRFQSARELAAALREILGKTSEAFSDRPNSNGARSLPTAGMAAEESAPPDADGIIGTNDTTGANRTIEPAVVARSAPAFGSTTGAISQDDRKLASGAAQARRRVPLWAVVAIAFTLFSGGVLWLRGAGRGSEGGSAVEAPSAATLHVAGPSARALPVESPPTAVAMAPSTISTETAMPAPSIAPRISASAEPGVEHRVAPNAGKPRRTAPLSNAGAKSAPRASPSASARIPPAAPNPNSNPLDIRF
jgi:serine/threonine-protein kinase